ncbi:hypothetical protein JCM8208_005415 [Rhodotorula glutinis]
MTTTRDLHLDPLNLPSTRFTSSSPATAGLAASNPGRFPSMPPSSDAPHSASAGQSKFRASLGGPNVGPTSSSGAAASNNWRAVSPGSRASTGADGFGAGGRAHGLRPTSELLSVSHGAHHRDQSGGPGAGGNGDTEAIDRWFEDLQQYEATLEDMAAASLDANFKEELSAIEQWFRVLSEAERTAALYSLLQSATPLQMRFFITILQQMARQDPVSAALLSPANPSQLSFESQIEHKLASFGLKSPASPVVRQFARQSLAASSGPAAAAAGPPSPAALDLLAPPDAAGAGATSSASSASANSPAASTLASQRAKLKASARTSAPANLLLSASGGSASLGESLKSPLWGKDETVRERSPSPRPKSTGSAHDGGNSPAPAPAAAAGAYLRSPVLDGSFDNQLSPLVGGNWASMVNTPLVPMFGKGEQMEQGNYGVASPNLDAAAHAGWNGAPTSPNPGNAAGPGGIVLDDARKFRRSARISGGALGGMYDEQHQSLSSSGGVAAASSALSASTASDRAQSAATAQKRVQDQLHAVQQLKNMQQSAINLGLGALGSSTNGGGNGNGGPPASPGLGGVNGSRLSSTGALSSPGLQQTAMQAQQNWRNANAAHLPPPSPQQQHQQGQHAQHHGHHGQQYQQQQHNLQQLQQQQQDLYGMHGGGLGGLGAGLAGLGVVGGGSPSPQQIQAQTQAQLASLVALQQQMIQQQQQLQSLASLNGLGIPNAGLGVGMGGLLGPQISPRLGTGGGGGGGSSPGVGSGFGLGFSGGMPSPRRSPRPHGNDRSPHFGSYGHSSRPGVGSSSAGAGGAGASGGGGANPQQTPGSGANPDEPLDMALLGDTPAWLRSLRLHKYTGIFEGSTWQEMAVMGDKDLEDKGVGALGARRKLLKVFETVRAKTGLAAPAGTSSNGSASSPVEGGNHSHSSPNSPTSDSLPVTPNMGARSPALDGADA